MLMRMMFVVRKSEQRARENRPGHECAEQKDRASMRALHIRTDAVLSEFGPLCTL